MRGVLLWAGLGAAAIGGCRERVALPIDEEGIVRPSEHAAVVGTPAFDAEIQALLTEP